MRKAYTIEIRYSNGWELFGVEIAKAEAIEMGKRIANSSNRPIKVKMWENGIYDTILAEHNKDK